MGRRFSLSGVLAVAAVALALAACGGSSSSGGTTITTSSGAGEAVLASAAAATQNAGSSKVAFTFTTTLPESLGGKSLMFTGSGAFDYANRRGTVSYDMAALFSQLGVPGSDKPVEARYEGTVFYMRIPFLSSLLPGGKPWLKVDLNALGSLKGLNLGSLQQLGQSDPTQLLDYLRATAPDVQKVGEEDVDGVSTTHYHGTVQLSKVPGYAPEDQRAQVQQAIDQLIQQTGTRELPTDVWIDGDGLVRKMTVSFTANVSDSNGGTVRTKSSIEMGFSDYGTAVNVEIPSDDQVTDLATLAGTTTTGS
jgi:hypothetical protein